MAENISPETRSRMMSGIRGTNTRPEKTVRSYLHRSGLRFRLHQRGLPGRPDLVLKRWNAVVFVHGCFWHGHEGCRYFKMPKSRNAFWSKKIHSNVLRDARYTQQLVASGWRVAVIWECALRDEPEKALDSLLNFIKSGHSFLEIRTPAKA